MCYHRFRDELLLQFTGAVVKATMREKGKLVTYWKNAAAALAALVLATTVSWGTAFADDASAGDGAAGLAAADANLQAPADEGDADGTGGQDQAEAVPMYRLYNGFTGEHFYTGDVSEKDSLVDAGWLYEGIGWQAPATSSIPVYRLYNPYAGDHHYTTSKKERDALVKAWWNDEGIGWYSDEQETIAVLRQYNPYAWSGTHNFTCSDDEKASLVTAGWKDEGVAWYAAGPGRQKFMTSFNKTHILALATCIGGNTSINTNAYAHVSDQNMQKLEQLLKGPTPVVFVAVNACTGACIARGADWRYYGASTIKAPFIAALCKYNAPGIGSWKNTMYSVITWSSNEGFDSLVAAYGTMYERMFASASAVNLQLPYGGGYADLTPRELCKLWVSIRDYICSYDVNSDMFRGLFGNGGYFKEGWMYSGMLGGQVYHVGGVKGNVVYAIMTRYQYRDSRVFQIRDAVVDAIG